MSQQIADFYAKISADASSLIEEAKKSQKQMDELSAKLKEAGVSQSAYNKTVADAKRAYADQQKAATGAADANFSLANSLKGMINPANLAMAAVTGLALYLNNASKAAAESAQVDAKLAAVLKATGNAAGLTADQIDEMSTALSKSSGMDDEMIKNGAAVLATFREIGSDVFPQAMQAALDMSAVMGQDLQSSIVQIGKALNDPIQGISALRRVGVQLSDEQEEQVQAFMESGQMMKAQAVILNELNMEFGGAAEAINEAGDGSASLKVSLGNLSEYIGGKLLPAVQAANEETTSWIDRLLAAAQASDAHTENMDRLISLGLQYGQTQTTITAELDGGTQASSQLIEQYKVLGTQYARSIAYGEYWSERLKATSAEQKAATISADELSARIGQLGEYMSTDLTDAQENYNKKIEDYKAQLEEARTAEEKMGIQEKIDAETEAYNKRAAAIMFNIQQEAILASNLSSTEKASSLAALAEGYGMIDEAQKHAIDSTSSLVEMRERGMITEQQFIDLLAATTSGLQETGAAADQATEPMGTLVTDVTRVTGQSEKAIPMIEKLNRGFQNLAEEGGKDAAGAAHNVAMGINAVNGLQANAYIDVWIREHGKMPKVGRGTNSGPGSGWSNNAGVDQEGDIYGGWTGGQLNGRYVIVGDSPSGWSPYAEVITPTGMVLDHKTSQKLKDAGMLEGAIPLRFGSEDGFSGGESAVYLQSQKAAKKKPPSGARPRPPRRDPGSTSATSLVAVPGDVDTVPSLGSSAVDSLHPAQLLMASATNKTNQLLQELNDNVTALASKTASETGIANAFGYNQSKYS